MADKFMNIFDVEKGKRFAYFKDYYLVPIIIFIVLIVLCVSLVKTIFFPVLPDSNIFMLAIDKPITYETEQRFRTALEEKIADNNEDGEIKLRFEPIIVSSSIEESDPEQMSAMSSKLTAVLSTGAYIIEIVDDAAFDLLVEENLVADYSLLKEYGFVDKQERTGLVKIPLSETKLDNVKGMEGLGDQIFITLRAPTRQSDNKGSGKVEYDKQVNQFLALLK